LRKNEPKKKSAPASPLPDGLSPKQRVFLDIFAQAGSVSLAAKKAEIGRRTHYDWLEQPAYKAAFEDATEDAAEALEREARRRAMLGTVRPVYYKGKPCGELREYSDVLLIFLLKGLKPEKYRENVNVNGSLDVNLAERLIAARERLRKHNEGKQ